MLPFTTDILYWVVTYVAKKKYVNLMSVTTF